MDTVLEVSVREVGFSTETYGSGPPFELFVETRGRLVRVSDGAELASVPLKLSSNPDFFAAWTADGGHLARAELHDLVRRLASDTVTVLFLLSPAAGEPLHWPTGQAPYRPAADPIRLPSSR